MKASILTRVLLVGALGLGGVATTACKSNPNRVRWDSILPPPGNTVIGTFEAQARKAEQDHYILYQRYFVRDKVALPPHGRDRLMDIAERLRQANYPVIIERSMDSQLDEARRSAVEAYLRSVLPSPIPESEDGLPSIQPVTTTETLVVMVAPSPSMPAATDDQTITLNREAASAGL